MRWRAWAAGVIFGLGLLNGIVELARLQGRYWPAPGAPSLPEEHEKLVQETGIRTQLPSRGTIGYRDELVRADPRTQARSKYLYFLFQYSLAPVLLDPYGKYE